MSDWKQRLIAERDELTERVDKLKEFTLSDQFSKLDTFDQHLLNGQFKAMCDYLAVLIVRVSRL